MRLDNGIPIRTKGGNAVHPQYRRRLPVDSHRHCQSGAIQIVINQV